jgi:hypothetical protein
MKKEETIQTAETLCNQAISLLADIPDLVESGQSTSQNFQESQELFAKITNLFHAKYDEVISCVL